ncbi:MAG: FAD-dependent oxidoreductase [Parasphingorhabdus sp.]
MKTYGVVIVGGGHAGAQAAIALRQLKYDGSILIISAESDPPYERPPLSKEYLSDEKTFERLYIKPPEYWGKSGIELMLDSEVVKVTPNAKTISLKDGSTLTYQNLIWAAGGKPRTLPVDGSSLPGVHVVRSRTDVDGIKTELDQVDQVAIVGGGYIGLEAAAVLRKLGKKVVLLEALDRVLARVAGKELSQFFEEEHRRQGVDLRTEVTVESITGSEKVDGINLAGGEKIAAQMAVIGIGIQPTIEPLMEAGADCENGVLVDQNCRTTLPDIYAIGDCAAHANGFANGKTVRLESVQNANDQAKVVAKAILGENASYTATPWFWSNQYDLKLQTVGLNIDFDETVVRGNIGSRSFSIIYLKNQKVIALDCVNAVKDYVQGKKLVEAKAETPSDRLADSSIPLKELLN